jgi:hypothetical protein
MKTFRQLSEEINTQLNEISKKTVSSYLKKAAPEHDNRRKGIELGLQKKYPNLDALGKAKIAATEEYDIESMLEYIEELESQLGEENKAREMAKDVAGSYSSSARLSPSNKAGYNAKMIGPSKTEFSAKRTALGLKPTVRKNWSTANEEYDVGSMLEYIEELEAAIDESGNPFKRLDSLEFQTKSKAAVDSLKGDKKKENLHNSQLKRLSSFRNKLATEETE